MAQYTCPYICPDSDSKPEHRMESKSKAKLPATENPHARAYVPGFIVPLEKRVYASDAPPQYLPQPTDSTSGDILGMGPIGPWAAGHMNWTPQAGITGVRPVVDKYSITHYSTGEWRKNNLYTLTPRATDKAKTLDATIRNITTTAFKKLDDKLSDTNTTLKEKVLDLNKLKKRAAAATKAMEQEIQCLDEDRTKLKGACKILMMPAAISKECLELRTHRYEPDLVRDDAEQELIKEVAIVGEIRKIFQETLAKVETQMLNNRAAKNTIESDWSDKMETFKLDSQNLNMGDDSNLTFYHPGVARWPENGTSQEYYEHFCEESIRNCEEVRQKSENLRKSLMSNIINGSRDLKTQAGRTDVALAETVESTKQVCAKLEDTLKDNLKTTADIENLIDYLKDSLRKLNDKNKLVMTRLHRRNYERPNVENCRDKAQYALMAEAKFVKESTEGMHDKLREAESVRAELMKYRGELEKDIACKRKSLNIDEDRISRVRAHMPTPEEFENA